MLIEIYYRPAIDPVPGVVAKPFSHHKNHKVINLGSAWMSKEEYSESIESCDWFVAPRLSEGIGMSFLDALALGVPVIAHDFPTMSEYVIKDVNGVLTDFDNDRKILLSKNLRSLQESLLKKNSEYLRESSLQLEELARNFVSVTSMSVNHKLFFCSKYQGWDIFFRE